MKKVNIHEAKTHLSRLIQEALNGEEIYMAKGNIPLVKLTIITEKKEREIGRFKGSIKISPDYLKNSLKISKIKKISFI